MNHIYYQGAFGTYTLKLSPMLGEQNKKYGIKSIPYFLFTQYYGQCPLFA